MVQREATSKLPVRKVRKAIRPTVHGNSVKAPPKNNVVDAYIQHYDLQASYVMNHDITTHETNTFTHQQSFIQPSRCHGAPLFKLIGDKVDGRELLCAIVLENEYMVNVVTHIRTLTVKFSKARLGE